jgi:acyl-coenzyme A synthetase/AMP-(fatty) acid ligase
VVVLDALPHTASGKIDYPLLRKRAVEMKTQATS